MNTHERPVMYWTQANLRKRVVVLGASERGLSFTGSPDEAAEWMEKSRKTRGTYDFVRDDERMKSYREQLLEYDRGERRKFELPLDPYGTPFQRAVWDALLDIPYGETCAYSDIAIAIGKPSAVRAVGGAIGSNPVMIIVPCHRVIGRNGSLTGFGGGLDWKRELLELEGVLERDAEMRHA